MRKTYCIIAAVLVAVGTMCAAQNGGCNLQLKAEDSGLQSSSGKPRGGAVIFGDPVIVPAFRLRFVDAKTGRTLKPSKVTLAYGWKWLEYPYPEHAWGAWSDASDVVSCTEISGDEIGVPPFEIKPRGWYKRRYTSFPFSRKPSFTGIDISATLPECSPRVTISAGDARGLQGRTVVVKVDCHGESKLIYQK